MKKYLSYILILIALVGAFGYGKEVKAQAGSLTSQIDQCLAGIKGKTSAEMLACLSSVEKNMCKVSDGPAPYASCTKLIKQAEDSVIAGAFKPTDTTAAGATAGAQTSTGSGFEGAIYEGCTFTPSFKYVTISGCFLRFLYDVFFQISALLLQISAWFFNALVALVIQSSMYNHGFISDAWTVVRDLSNIFFILILLYIAIKTVMNMGGHETKSMITSVIIMAILINFSMFFTKIVIDSSNILAQVFYNKLETRYKDANGNIVERPQVATIKGGTSDVSGALYEKFNLTKLISPEFIQKLKQNKVNNIIDTNQGSLPVGITISILFITASLMLVAAYTFFSSGIFFLGRILELWLLMIFAPFAFMSFAIPKLRHTEYGWDKWTEKLISASFMAPVFMFFLYLIFKLLGTKDFFYSFLDTSKDAGWTAYMLGVLLPALIILGLLLKAKDLAKRAGGQFGEMAMSVAKTAGVLALGAAAGGTAAAGRFAVGRTAATASREAMKYDSAINKFTELQKTGVSGPLPPKPKNYTYGAEINAAQKRVADVEHGVHQWADLKKEAHVENVPNDNLSGPKIQEMQNIFLRKNLGAIKAEIRDGADAQGKPHIIENDVDGNKIDAQGESDYNVKRKQIIESQLKNDPKYANTTTKELKEEGKEELVRRTSKDQLSKEFNELLKSMAAQVATDKFNHIQHGATEEKVTLKEKALAKAPGGTYDLRKVADIVTKNTTPGAKFTLGLTAAVAMAVRSGFKSAGLNLGKAQGNVYKDIGEIVTEALKNVKITVPSGGGGDHGHGGDSHGGGGHH